MRPWGHIRLALQSALVDGGGTCRELARRVNEPVHRVRVVLDNMCKAGDAAKAQPVRVPGVCRPVPVYVRAQRAHDLAAADDAPHVSLIQAWVGMTPTTAQGARM